MQTYFQELAQGIFAKRKKHEQILLNYSAEDSDFVRLNHNKIRQAGFVRQQSLDINLIVKQKQSAATIQLQGNMSEDLAQAQAMLQTLRSQIAVVPADPYLNFATELNHSEFLGQNQLPQATDALEDVIHTAQNLDLVGIWASGEMLRGFANSLGQFNWHRNYNFNFDWSVYHQADKAIKQNYAGFDWNKEFLQKKIAFARETLPILQQSAISIKPGKYRVFLAPSAVQELMDMLNWGGFGLKSHKTLQTPLLKMIKEGKQLHPHIRLSENNQEGLTPCFTHEGFIKPKLLSIIDKGDFKQCLVDARSAMEYGTAVNCSTEYAQSLELNSGDLHQDNILKVLDTGIFISNLWYCNYSDRNACRITGMTRFACIWVENGKPVAPLNVMRFDESLYNILGDNLIDLTVEHEHILDTSTYEGRSQSSSRLPGALVEDFRFTL